MSLHETIKSQIKEAMIAKDSLRLEVLRGLNALFMNDLIAKASAAPFVNDETALAFVKRSVKQRKDSIDQFDKGGRQDLADKERAELAILEAYLPKTMSRDEIKKFAQAKIGTSKPDKAAAGKLTGELMRDLKGKADGADVKAVLDELLK